MVLLWRVTGERDRLLSEDELLEEAGEDWGGEGVFPRRLCLLQGANPLPIT